MIPFGAGITASVTIGRDLGADQYAAAWIASSYPSVRSFAVVKQPSDSLSQANAGSLCPDGWPPGTNIRSQNRAHGGWGLVGDIHASIRLREELDCSLHPESLDRNWRGFHGAELVGTSHHYVSSRPDEVCSRRSFKGDNRKRYVLIVCAEISRCRCSERWPPLVQPAVRLSQGFSCS